MKNVMKKLSLWIGLILIVVLALFMLWFSILSVNAPSHGQHTGYVTAVEQEGWIWKTWKAYVKTDPQSSQEDTYCVINKAVVSQLQSVEQHRQLVTLQYSTPFVVFKWQCNFIGAVIDTVSLSQNIAPLQ